MTATIPEETAVASAEAPAPTVAVKRRTIDLVLILTGAVVAVVLAVAGGLLMWGSNFAEDYVHDELSSQNIFFSDEATLREEGHDDLVKWAEQQVTTGAQAEGYAAVILGHMNNTADGATYADLGGPQRAARTALADATEAGATEAEIAELQATVDQITAQRETLFKGETLRGLLLSAYAWSEIGRIAGIAAWVAWIGAAAMVVMVVLGMVHRHRTPA